jgi:two-component system sensor histidine kinase PilS (NtrC family)
MADKPATIKPATRAGASPQNITLFRIYVLYRSLLSILLLLALLNTDTQQLVGILNPTVYLYVACAFLATNLVLLGLIRSPFIHQQPSLFSVFFIDILVITLLADTSGGMVSGLPILLVVTAAASAILISSGTIATLIAALSVIAVLVDTTRLINEQVLPINSLFPAGLLGMLIFAVSLLVQAVARRVGKAEDLARKRAADLYNMQLLNEEIVKNLQTGILIVYADETVSVMNQAAIRLLDPEVSVAQDEKLQLSDYNPNLAEQFQQWRRHGIHLARPLQVKEESPQIIASFRTLDNSESGGDALVFIEDYSSITHRAQSLKLASLGRLTASIAHEIRNPLGAVSHASQLLGESSQLPAEDQRLTEIIAHHTQRMNAIIENVMQISRRQAPKPQPLDLKTWLQKFLAEYRAVITHDSEVSLEFPDQPVEIRFDPEHLERVLGNLMDNALRHSQMATGQATAQIVVSWEPQARRCLIDVLDQGLGVADSERANLFEPFYTTVEKGSGLGLYLCKELCEINHATLVYHPCEQGQSRFRLTLRQRD